MVRTCKQCGKEFFLPQSEIKFYKDKNLSLPKRCKECRDKNKEEKNTAVSASENKKEEVNGASENGHKGGKSKNGIRATALGFATIFLVTIGRLLGNNSEEPVTDPTPYVTEISQGEAGNEATEAKIKFSSEESLLEHYEKHGKDMGFASPEAYEAAASAVVSDSRALHKNEEDGDDLYYIVETNEYVVVSAKTGKILSYYLPDRGKEYFDGK